MKSLTCSPMAMVVTLVFARMQSGIIRGVRNTEAGDTVNLTVLVDHGHRVKFRPHLAFRWPRSKARCSISSAKSVFDR